MHRREFIKCAGTCAGLCGATIATPALAATATIGLGPKRVTPLTIRPYQLLCTICSLGDDGNDPQYAKARKIRGSDHPKGNGGFATASMV